MYNPLPHLPRPFQRFIRTLKDLHFSNRLLVFAIGFLATLWFLIRVIPKPSRATYPCMQATAPFMAGFVLYIGSMAGSVFAFKRLRALVSDSRYITAFLVFIAATALLAVGLYQLPGIAFAKSASSVRGTFPPNEPFGDAKGIHPGRVVWMWDSEATNELCTNTSNNNGVIDDDDDAWFMAKNNNQQVIDSMLIKSLLVLTGGNTLDEVWDAIFRYYNNSNGYGNMGYSPDQKVFIKINTTTAYGGLSYGKYYADLSRNDNLAINDFAAETNPFLVVSMLRQLVYEAGVPQNMIYVGDPARNVYKEFFDLWKAEFPLVNVLGNNLLHPELDVVGLGRVPVAVTQEDLIFYSDNGEVMPGAISDKLFTIFEEMDYLINIPTMKAHATAGITLAAKNHFGSFPRTWAMHLHPGLFDGVDDPIRLGYGLYRIQTDIMFHSLLGMKNLFMIVDGLYPGEDALGVPFKWTSIPFNGDWCSSIFLSFDPVAIESVCHDFLRTEYNGPGIGQSRPNWHGVDDYLHQAADFNLWPEGVLYNPDNTGPAFVSLGVHEHWNDSLNKQYSRNLGTGYGIELLKAHEMAVSLPRFEQLPQMKVFPNPFAEGFTVENSAQLEFTYSLYDVDGRMIYKGFSGGEPHVRVAPGNLPPGIYFLKTNLGHSIRLVKTHSL